MGKFDYNLPPDRIAMHPKEIRHNARLLVSHGEYSTEDTYLNIADHLPSNAKLIFNNTKVIAARIFFKKQTGGIIEIFLLEPANGTPHATALAEKRTSTWKCLVGGVKKWKNDELLECPIPFEIEIILHASLKSKYEDYCEIEFSWEKDNLYFSDIIEKAGKIPLPPYIKRDATEDDSTRYQTVYADKKGSVAAPTAGLHFTEEVFDSLKKKGIDHSFVTLHVGAGTFKPVSTPTIASHNMHEEYFEINRQTIEDLADENKMIVAVGTTSLRTIESIYWLGVKQILQADNKENKMNLLKKEA